MRVDNYLNGKGPLERQFVEVTGKSHMRVGRRLKKKYAGLGREEIAGRLLKRLGYSVNPNTVGAQRAKQSTVIQSLELKPGRLAKLEMPADLTSEEAAMLIKV